MNKNIVRNNVYLHDMIVEMSLIGLLLEMIHLIEFPMIDKSDTLSQVD